MADPYVRILGEVADLDDVRVGVGVDYDAVTVGQLRFSAGQAEELAQLFIAACWQAGQQKAAMDREAAPDAAQVTVSLACTHGAPGDGARCVLGWCPACQRLVPVTKDALTAPETATPVPGPGERCACGRTTAECAAAGREAGS